MQHELVIIPTPLLHQRRPMLGRCHSTRASRHQRPLTRQDEVRAGHQATLGWWAELVCVVRGLC